MSQTELVHPLVFCLRSPSSVIPAGNLGLILGFSLLFALLESTALPPLVSTPPLHPSLYCLISGVCHLSDGSPRHALSLTLSPSNQSVLFSAVITNKDNTTKRTVTSQSSMFHL